MKLKLLPVLGIAVQAGYSQNLFTKALAAPAKVVGNINTAKVSTLNDIVPTITVDGKLVAMIPKFGFEITGRTSGILIRKSGRTLNHGWTPVFCACFRITSESTLPKNILNRRIHENPKSGGGRMEHPIFLVVIPPIMHPGAQAPQSYAALCYPDAYAHARGINARSERGSRLEKTEEKVFP